MGARYILGLIAVFVLSYSANAAIPDDYYPEEQITQIHLRSGVLDASEDMEVSELQSVLDSAALVGGHVVLRFSDPLTYQQRNLLAALGLQLQYYIPYRAWTAKVTSVPSVIDLVNLYGLRWAGSIAASWKISPNVVTDEELIVYFHPDVSYSEALTVVESLEDFELSNSVYIECINSFDVPGLTTEELNSLVESEEVWMIEKYLGPVTEVMDQVRPMVSADEVHNEPYEFDGAGVTAMIIENYFAPDRPDFAPDSPEDPPRIIWESPNHSDCNEHAAVVGCVIAGNGGNDPNATYRGIAPGAKLLSFRQERDLEHDLRIAVEGFDDGNEVHETDVVSLSLGYNLGGPIGGLYNVYAHLADRAVTGGIAGEAYVGERPVVVFAAGNGTSVEFGVSAGGVAKNTISVAATVEDGSIWDNSDWGPTHDYRIKPEIAAPGALTSCDCTVSGTFTGVGTSYATPVVAGAAVLLVEKYRDEPFNSDTPEPSEIRAALIASTIDYEDPGPDVKYGYGLLDIERAIQIVTPNTLISSTIESGQELNIQTINISEGTGLLRVVVAWDDIAPAPGVAVDLVNDLDAWLVPPIGEIVRPYTFDRPGFTSVQRTDRRNNLEFIEVADPQPGDWKLYVRAADIAEDNDGDLDGVMGQRFSYAIFTQPTVVYDNLSYYPGHGVHGFGTPYSVVIWNFDGEEDDLFYAMSNEAGITYMGQSVGFDGVPAFVRLQPPHYADGLPPAGLRGIAAADIGNDRLELFAAHEDGAKLYSWNGAQMEERGDLIAPASETTHSTAGAWGDFNGDGKMDLIVCRAYNFQEDPPMYDDWTILGSSTSLYRNDGGIFSKVSGTGIPLDFTGPNASWGYAGIEEESDRYLFLGSYNAVHGGSQLYLVSDPGALTQVTSRLDIETPLTTVNGNAWADFNNDLVPDLIVSHFDGKMEIFFGDGQDGFDNGNGGWGSYTVGSTYGYSGFVVYDYNGDFKDDIVALPNDSSRGLELFENRTESSGAPVFVERATEVDLLETGYGHGAVAGDFCGTIGDIRPPPDGVADLLIGRPADGHGFLYRGRRTGQSGFQIESFVQIRLACESGMDNPMGIGSVVTVQAGDQRQMRVVDGGSMRGGQSDTDLVFSLNGNSGPMSASVKWPSGLIQPDVPLLLGQLNIIENNAIAVNDNTIKSFYVLKAGGLADWSFTWETNVAIDPDLDTVIFNMGAIPPACQPEYESITRETSEDIELIYKARQGGGFTHQLTWKNRPCVTTCAMPFWVSSGLGAEADTSSVTRSLNIKICTSTSQ